MFTLGIDVHVLATRARHLSKAERNLTSDIRGRLEKKPGGVAPNMKLLPSGSGSGSAEPAAAVQWTGQAR